MAVYKERITTIGAVRDIAEIGGGFVLNGYLGRAVENTIVTTPVIDTSSTSEKIIAGAANNVPKLGLYYLLNKVNLPGAAASAMGSIGYDLLIRLTNNGINPASAYVKWNNQQYRILKEQQQNKQETQAMPWWGRPQEAEQQRRYGAMPFSNQPAPVLDRQRKYGAMPNFDRPLNWKQPSYGSLPFHDDRNTEVQFRYGFSATSQGKPTEGKIFGML